MTKPADPTPQAPARPPIRRWKKAVFALIAVVAFFALAELALWAVGVPTLLEREDPFRGFSGLLSVYQRDGDVYPTRRALAGGVCSDQAFQADKPANGLR
ncbi:MAG: hypothetical protein NT031_08380, partial [Planctomycetota bacterium]|nr:hypothetical protein [Planctomycetota bacterium]